MVGAQARRQLATGRGSQHRSGTQHRWHRRPWPQLRLPRSIVGTLERLDDDPVLLCDCAEGAPHTCG